MAKKKKKVILVQPTGYNWIPEQRDITRKVNVMVPVGLCSIASFLEAKNIETIILDGYAKPMELKEWVKIILDEKPDFLGISTTTSSFLEGVQLASAVKKVAPEIRNVFGGVHVSAIKEKCIADFPVIDFAVVGEGEETLFEIIERDGKDIEDVEGIVYRGKDSNDIKFTGIRKKTLNLDSLPFPAYDKLDGFPESYRLPIFSYSAEPATNVISSRGCPYACSYCDRSVFGRSFRWNSGEYVHSLMSWLKKRWGIKHITFYDDIFTANRKRVESLCKILIDHPLDMTFYCAVRANHLDEELLRMLKQAGCWQISFGVESGDPNIVQMHRKESDLDEIKEKVFMIKKLGMRVKGLFIIGFPGDTEETIRRTIDYACSVPFDEINVSKFTPFLGAPVYRNIHQFGKFEENWEKLNLLNFVFIPEGLTREKLEELYREFILRFYNRPSVMFNYMKLMLSSPCHIKRIVQGLPEFSKYLFSLKGLNRQEEKS